MAKYLVLIVFNIPFVIFGIANAIIQYKESRLNRTSMILRLAFWLVVAAGLIFARYFYNFLIGNKLTDSTPLSLADVILATGLNFCLFLCLRLYAKVDSTERKLHELHERLSVMLSEEN